MLNRIEHLNKETKFYTTEDKEFSQYGRCLSIDVHNVIDLLKKEQREFSLFPKAQYVTDRQELHDFACFDEIRHNVFGELPIQFGVVKGRNLSATGTEFHQGSEVNIAVTDCVLILGSKYDLVDESIDIASMKAFYIQKGEVIEIYSSTLHYTPIEVDDSGFSLGVILLEGTNTDIPFEKGSMLSKKNKWYLCHESQSEKRKAGFKVGLTGKLFTIIHD